MVGGGVGGGVGGNAAANFTVSKCVLLTVCILSALIRWVERNIGVGTFGFSANGPPPVRRHKLIAWSVHSTEAWTIWQKPTQYTWLSWGTWRRSQTQEIVANGLRNKFLSPNSFVSVLFISHAWLLFVHHTLLFVTVAFRCAIFYSHNI